MAAPETRFDLGQILAPIAPALQQVEQQIATQVVAFDPTLEEYFRHALGGQGKRLRPALALLSSAAASGGEKKWGDDHIKLGVIVELIHLATLVHDDVMDQADLRHNRTTTRAHWGNETAVLLGDCLFAHALKLAASFPTTEVCRCVSEATNTVCSGEILQTRRRYDPSLTITEYLRIIEMKTGALFAVSCDLGAYLSCATPRQRQALREFGQHLGTAYQIYDDCVDIFGEESRAGKSLGTDVACGKLTLPVLVCLDQALAHQRKALADDLLQSERRGRKPMRQILGEHHALEHSLKTMERYLQQARAALEGAGSRQTTRPLADAAQFLSQQARALTSASVELAPLSAVA